MNEMSTICAMRAAVVCREMTDADGDSVVALLTRGFAEWRDRGFWVRALNRLKLRSAPAGLPQFGYVLEVDGEIVGVLLLISSEVTEAGRRIRRCNVSSWFVEPEYRLYGSMLVGRAIRQRDVVYMNVTPAPATWDVLAAQGYVAYAKGRAVVFPALCLRASKATIEETGPELAAGPDLSDEEVTLLRDHAQWDCLTVICRSAEGRVPFVFGRRVRGGLQYAYLLYCRDLGQIATYARPLGRYLARCGIMFLVADANERLPGLAGWFQPAFPKFFRGGQPPRPGDLAYTERAMFGV